VVSASYVGGADRAHRGTPPPEATRRPAITPCHQIGGECLPVRFQDSS